MHLMSSGTPSMACIYAAVIKGAGNSLASRDGQHVLSFSSRGALQLANAQSQAIEWMPARLEAAANIGLAKATSLCLTPGGTLLLSGSTAGPVLWQSTPPTAARGAAGSATAPGAAGSTTTYMASISSRGQVVVLDSQCAQVYPAATPTRATATRPPRALQSTLAAGRRPRKSGASSIGPPPPSQRPPALSAESSGPATIKLESGSLSQPQLPAQLVEGQPSTQTVADSLQVAGSSATTSTASDGLGSATATPAACPPGAHKASDIDSLCGGSNLCGLDTPCTTMVCCTDGLTCRRRNVFTWTCLL